jgi:divalent metal cation (Fe/Co/Zn/Cd) transporter
MPEEKPMGPVFEIDSIVICGITIVTKLILFLVCRRCPLPSTQALAQDHRNDVLSNSVAVACGIIGYRLWKYADSIGAVLISIYIVVSWCITGWQQIKMLTGHTARPDFLKKITWMSVTHDERITHIETVRAFHFGNNFLVEVDIVLPKAMSLLEAHDIGEKLQSKLEKLEDVERAFVHLDYDIDHDPETEHKVV